MTQPLAYEIELTTGFDEAIDKVTAALKDQGFGVLTRIDVQDTLKQKLDADFRPYVILGACNPQLAYRALSQRPEIGLLLPCNVVVEAQDEARVLVRIGNPDALLSQGGLAQDPILRQVADEAVERLTRTVKALQVG